MSEEPVGKIRLDLILKDTLAAQINKIASRAQGTAQKDFGKVGLAIEASIAKPIEAAQEAINSSVEGAKQKVQGAGKAMGDSLAKPMVDAQGTIDRAVENAKLKVQEQGNALDALSAKLDAMRDKSRRNLSTFYQNPKQLHGAVEKDLGGNKDYQKLLQQNDKVQQKLIAAENKLQLAKELAAQKAAARQQAIREKQAVAVKRLQEREKQAALKAEQQRVQAAQRAEQAQLRAAERAEQQKRRIRQQTQRDISKAMKQLGGMAGNSGKRVTALTAGMGKKIKSAISSVGKKVSQMLRNFKTAFKSAILMASLYAAFRGLKETIGGVINQNERFKTSLNQVKANLSVAFVPVINAILPALNALMSGLAYASKKLAEFTASFFGTTYKQSVNTMKKIQSTSNAAKKARKDALASFDQINKLDTGKNESASDTAGGTDYGALDGANYGDSTKLANEIEAHWKAVAKRIPEFIAAALTKAAEAAPRMVGVAASIMSTFLQSLHAQWPQIATAGIGIITALLGGMHQLVPDIIPVAVDVITFLIQAFLTYMPQLVATGIELLAGILSGLAQKMPELIPMAQQGIRLILSTLTAHLPEIINSGMDILLSLIEGIVQMLPEIIPAVQQAIMTLLNALIDHLPEILKAGMDILFAVIDGIIEMIPELIPAVQKIIMQITMALLEHLPDLIEAGIDLVIALVEGMINNIDVIAREAPRLIVALVKGLWGARQKVIDCISNLVREMVNKIKSIDWIEVGKNILRGIANGIKAGLKAVKNLLSFDNFKTMFTGGKVNFDIPSFAEGGIISQPMPAIVGDNKHSPEAVAPLHELQGFIDKAVRGAMSAFSWSGKAVDQPPLKMIEPKKRTASEDASTSDVLARMEKMISSLITTFTGAGHQQQMQPAGEKNATIILQLDGTAFAQWAVQNLDALYARGNQTQAVKV